MRDTILRSSWFIRVMHESSMCEIIVVIYLVCFIITVGIFLLSY